ncbi:MAG: oligoendopeptidase F, partial [Proteobacteria bacterium]|nr:oligoendopeptidase F [Pseudomonadota bacterium]
DAVSADLKWDLTSMYASSDAWEADFTKAEALLPQLTKYKGKLTESGQVLLAAIEEAESIQMLVGDLYVYAGLKSFEDMRDSESGERFSRARTLISRYGELSAWFSPELLAADPEQVNVMISETPGLEVHRHNLDQILRQRPYILSESEEKLLSMAGDPLSQFSNVFTRLNNADLTFGEIEDENGNTVELNDSRYGTFIHSTNRRVREDAWKGLFQGYEKLGNTLAANYAGHVSSRAFLAKARGYDSRLQAATFNSAIPQEVFTNLIAETRKGTAPLQRYLELRRQALGLETLEIWDLYAPIIEPTMKDIPWEEAKQVVAEALAPLGQEYLDVYWMGFDEGWVDAVDNKGKRGGAYSWGTYNSAPFFSMKYEGTLGDVSTLAHEYGHSMHSYLRHAAQPYAYGGARTFIAEVASMTNEALLIQKLLAEADSREDRIFLLQNYLDNFRGSFYRQVSFADFEMQAHEVIESGNALSKDRLNEIYAGVFNAYYGDGVRADPLNAIEWSRIPHFLRTDNFYVYQYATSFAAATALARAIREEGEPARQRFMALLKAGDSDYSIELLKQAGVDMTTPQPIRDTIAEFDRLVDELEAALAE